MGRKIDVGSYFEKLTKRGEGGRRLEVDEHDEPARTTSSRRTTSSSPSSSSGSSRGRSPKDILRDALGRGRRTVETTTKRARDAATRRAPTRRTPTTPTRAGRTLPPGGIVTIEYSPQLDGDPDPGEVVWTWVPFEEDPEQGKDRPVIVVGRRGRKLVGVPLTTKRSSREAQISIGTGKWDPKRRQSYARIWRMLDIDAERTRREGAVLDRERFDEVVAAVDEYYEIRRLATAPADDFDYDY